MKPKQNYRKKTKPERLFLGCVGGFKEEKIRRAKKIIHFPVIISGYFILYARWVHSICT